jgi:putative ABC transport system permease protein
MLVRAALGAGRVRLFRQLLAESLLLGNLAGFVGLTLAFWALESLHAVLPPDLAATVNVQVDLRVALVALGACVATAAAFGMAPAYFILRSHDAGIVRGGRTGETSSAPARRVLVVVQVALAVVLLTGAGLLMRSFVRLSGVDPGFDPDRLLTLTIELPQSRYRGPAEWQPFFERLRSDLRSLPGVENAAGVSGLPMNENGGSVGFYVEGEPLPADNEATFVIYRLTTPGYFATMRIPLIDGRDFSPADGPAAAPRVVVVNRTFARRYWPGTSAVGKRVAFTTKPTPEDWATVVGVVGDTHHSSLAEAIDVQMYVPYTQEPNWYPPGQIVLRTAVDPSTLASAARDRIRTIDPLIPVGDIQTMEGIIGRSVSTPRFHLMLLAILSASALLLAVVGIYGLLAFSVALRTREIGVRCALGATRRSIARMIMNEGLRLTGAGLLVGLAIAFAATRWLDTLLFEIGNDDPITFAGIAVLLLAVATLACYVPARRAAQVDPLIALRGD